LLDQNILSIDAPHEPRLDNFVVGDNAELIKALRQPVQGFCAIWIYGDLSSGKSHLLQGCYHEAQAGGGNCFSIDCSDCQGLDYYSLEQIFRPALDSSLDEGDAGVLVVVDDAHLLKSNRHGEELLMALYNHLMNIEGTLLISHNQSAMAENFDLADLNSRMRSLGHYQIMPLDDHGKARVLRLRAEERGYHLSETVLDYWLRRGPRKLQVLLQDLEKLDFATLQLKRTLTVPLLKEVLGY
jgi:DnaA family protein